MDSDDEQLHNNHPANNDNGYESDQDDQTGSVTSSLNVQYPDSYHGDQDDDFNFFFWENGEELNENTSFDRLVEKLVAQKEAWQADGIEHPLLTGEIESMGSFDVNELWISVWSLIKPEGEDLLQFLTGINQRLGTQNFSRPYGSLQLNALMLLDINKKKTFLIQLREAVKVKLEHNTNVHQQPQINQIVGKDDEDGLDDEWEILNS